MLYVIKFIIIIMKGNQSDRVRVLLGSKITDRN